MPLDGSFPEHAIMRPRRRISGGAAGAARREHRERPSSLVPALPAPMHQAQRRRASVRAYASIAGAGVTAWALTLVRLSFRSLRCRGRGTGMIGLALALVPMAPGRVEAQVGALVRECAQEIPPGSAREFCNLVAQGIEILQPRLGLAFTGGNPVPGTASTLGMRIGTLPRLSLGGRITGVLADLPPIRERGDREELSFLLPTINADGSIGIFGGISPAPTVGGLGSVDALVSAGLLPLPGSEGFDTGALFGWGLGARLGILRESFTLPGISVSGMYRHVGDVTFGDPSLSPGGTESFFDYGLSGFSLRGAVSKRLFTVGVTVGGGYDWYSSDVAFGVRNPTTVGPERFRFDVDGYDDHRLSAFANLSWTLLILHVVGELGWQSGGERVPGGVPLGVDLDPEDGAFFGGLAVRLSI